MTSLYPGMHRISLRVLSMGLTCLVLSACGSGTATRAVPRAPGVESLVADPSAFWNSATVYFLLTDRFFNGDPSNDLALGRPQDGAVLRSYMGGDLEGVLAKLEEGWFDSLGVSAIWMTPFLEQIQGSVDEGTGKTYAFHGYWTKDWTAVEPALGTVDDLRALVDAAHARGIRVIFDAIINHTGPVTPLDPQWPDEWVRTGPRCAYDSYERTVPCTLVDTRHGCSTWPSSYSATIRALYKRAFPSTAACELLSTTASTVSCRSKREPPVLPGATSSSVMESSSYPGW